jgi:hypothetical protein
MSQGVAVAWTVLISPGDKVNRTSFVNSAASMRSLMWRCQFTHEFLLTSHAQGIAQFVKQLISQLGFHLLGGLERSITITIRDLALAKRPEHLIRISYGSARFECASKSPKP